MTVFRRLRAWLRRSRLDAELREELAQHTAWKTESLMADGLDRQEAHRRAAIAVGNVTKYPGERARRLGLSGARQPGAGHPLRRPRPRQVSGLHRIRRCLARRGHWRRRRRVQPCRRGAAAHDGGCDPASLVLMRWRSGPVFPFSSLSGNGEQNTAGLASTSFSYAAYQSFRTDASRTLDVLGFADLYEVNAAIPTAAPSLHQRTRSPTTTSTCSALLRSSGGDLVPSTTASMPLPAAVISDRFWKRRFGSSADAVGRAVAVNAIPFTVVGIAPATFHGTGQVGSDPDLYVPVVASGAAQPV